MILIFSIHLLQHIQENRYNRWNYRKTLNEMGNPRNKKYLKLRRKPLAEINRIAQPQ